MIYAQKLIEKMQAIIDDEEKQDGWESFLEILECPFPLEKEAPRHIY